MNDLENSTYDMDNIINHIRGNCIELMNEKHSKQKLLSNGVMKGKSLLTGNINKQTVVDLCSICIAFLLAK